MGSPKERRKLEESFADLLTKWKIPFEQEADAGGVRADFLVRTPEGKAAVDVKTWPHSAANRDRAARQTALYRRYVGVDKAFVIVKDRKTSDPKKGVISARDVRSKLLPMLMATKTGEAAKATPEARKISAGKRRIVFAAMPFAPDFDDVYFIAMSRAAKAVNAVCERIDQQQFTGDIAAEIQRRIRRSHAVIADLSLPNPNVFYETGYAHALARPTVHICRTPLKDLPFDVRNFNTIEYTAGQIWRLEEPLTRRLRAIL